MGGGEESVSMSVKCPCECEWICIMDMYRGYVPWICTVDMYRGYGRRNGRGRLAENITGKSGRENSREVPFF